MISPRGVEVSSTLSIMSSVLYIRSAAFCVIWRTVVRVHTPRRPLRVELLGGQLALSPPAYPLHLEPVVAGLKACEQKPNILAFGTQRHPSIPR